MCGIVCAFDLKESVEKLRPQLLEMSKKVRHRGPDWSGIYANEKAVLAHERLAIVDPASGKQPLFSPDGKLIAITNFQVEGEIDEEEDPYGLGRIVGSHLYTATQVYDLNGEFHWLTHGTP